MDQDLLVCVNSDDPAYFSSYINDNYIQIVEKHNLTREHILKVCLLDWRILTFNS